MGSDRKSKDKTKKRRSVSQSEDEEGQAKRHRKSSDEHGAGSSKRDKKEGKTHHKSSKRHRSEVAPFCAVLSPLQVPTQELDHLFPIFQKPLRYVARVFLKCGGAEEGQEKKSEKKHNKEQSKDDRHSIADFKELSNDDYFAKNNEFATWLKEEKKKFFSDLSSDSARELFAKFVEKWNSRKLEMKYYEGISVGPRSSHAWKIKS